MSSGAVACTFFLQGRCNRGDSCGFSHDPNAPVGAGPKKVAAPASQPCKFEMTQPGSCRFGMNCRYIHPQAPLFTGMPATAPVMQQRKPRGQQACRFFQRGNCRYGSDCKFAHVSGAIVVDEHGLVTAAPDADTSATLNDPSDKAFREFLQWQEDGEENDTIRDMLSHGIKPHEDDAMDEYIQILTALEDM